MPPSQADGAALKERIARLPRSPGVYLWKGGADEVLYVGKALDLRSRVTSYFDPDRPKTAALMAEALDVDIIAVRNEKEALLLEQTLIKRHRPRYNVRLNDDKSYPYLKLTNEEYPRLLKVHRREDDGATYFGPFPDGTGAWHVLQVVNDLVPLRRCKVLPKEKCLYYDIGKCVAPCITACTDAEYALLVGEVRDLLSGRAGHLLGTVAGQMEAAAAAERFEEAARLRDQLHGLQSVLERQHMVVEKLEDRDVAAIAARGEVATVVVLHQRDGLIVGQSPFVLAGAAPGEEAQALAAFLLGYYQDRLVPRHVAADFPEAVATQMEGDLRLLAERAVSVETPQKGAKRRWIEVAETNARLRLEEEIHRRSRRGAGAVEALQHALGLPRPPRAIEGFDVSHFAGAHTRAALVRFQDGEPDKSGYRTFNMRLVGETAVAAGTAESKGEGREVDDFASIGEAVQRRYRGVVERGEPLPDLVLVDGGPGQLAAARESLRSLGLALPLASLAKREEEVYLPGRMQPVRMKRSDPALQLLQRVRDEAHRFGIQQVQRKSAAGAAASPLDEVVGIGPRRRAELVKAFGGLEGLRAASAEDLQRVKGVTAKVAQAIVQALQGEE
ncbi:MAG: excinuclease ABC subunit UvrC [Thermoplasmatota archaeon]